MSRKIRVPSDFTQQRYLHGPQVDQTLAEETPANGTDSMRWLVYSHPADNGHTCTTTLQVTRRDDVRRRTYTKHRGGRRETRLRMPVHMPTECPRCHIAPPSSQSRYCSRCGEELPGKPVKPIMIEKPHSLLNPWLGLGIVVVVTGTALANYGWFVSSAVVMGVGVLILLIVVAQNRKH